MGRDQVSMQQPQGIKFLSTVPPSVCDTHPTQQEHRTPHPFGAVAPKADDPLEPQDGIWQEALKQANSQ